MRFFSLNLTIFGLHGDLITGSKVCALLSYRKRCLRFRLVHNGSFKLILQDAKGKFLRVLERASCNESCIRAGNITQNNLKFV